MIVLGPAYHGNAVRADHAFHPVIERVGQLCGVFVVAMASTLYSQVRSEAAAT
jgi:hypothetical protein